MIAKDLQELLKQTEEATDDKHVLALRGNVLFQLGEYQAAIEQYSLSIDIGQNNDQFVANCCIPVCLFSLYYYLILLDHSRAEAYLHLGDTEKAEQDLQRAVALNPIKKEEYLLLQQQFKKTDAVGTGPTKDECK